VRARISLTPPSLYGGFKKAGLISNGGQGGDKTGQSRAKVFYWVHG